MKDTRTLLTAIGTGVVAALGLAWLASTTDTPTGPPEGKKAPPGPPGPSGGGTVPEPPPPEPAEPDPTVTDHVQNRHREARPIIVEALTSVLGRPPTLAEIQYGQAIAWHESNYGRGWKDAMIGSNNWGAVQCGAGSDPAKCIPYTDSYADGTRYTVTFRRYASPLEGATDMLRHVFTKRPRVAAALASAYPSSMAASLAMRREKYYEGFCNAAAKAHGASAVRPSFASPDKNDATRACDREAVNGHGKKSHNTVRDIAFSLKEPVALRRGTYDEALAAWQANAGAAPPSSSQASASSSSSSTPAKASAPSSPSSPGSSGSAAGALARAVRAGDIAQIDWVPLIWSPPWGGTYQVFASADAVKAGPGRVRLPVSYAESIALGREQGWIAPVYELADTIWRSATIHLEPHPLPATSEMGSVAWAERFSKDIDTQIAGRVGVVADVGKDWVIANRNRTRAGRSATTYGWRDAAGVPIQGRGQETTQPAHDDQHFDYSQTLRPIKRIAVDAMTGTPIDLADVYAAGGVLPEVLAPWGASLVA